MTSRFQCFRSSFCGTRTNFSVAGMEILDSVFVYVYVCVRVHGCVLVYLCFGIFKMVTDSRDVGGQSYVAP